MVKRTSDPQVRADASADTLVTVRAGQRWRDNDPRRQGRVVVVKEVAKDIYGAAYAVLVQDEQGTRTTTIQLNRFGYQSPRKGFTLLPGIALDERPADGTPATSATATATATTPEADGVH